MPANQKIALSKVCDISMGQAPKGESYNLVGDGYPLIAGAGDFGLIYPESKKWTNNPTKLTEKDDIILCIRATIGDSNWADKTYCLGRGVAGLRAKSDKLDRHYLWHWIGYSATELRSKGRGAIFLQVSKSDIAALEIPLPPLSEQKRIAAILDAADALRTQRRQSIAELDRLLQSTFLEMFGDPVENPNGWKIGLLGDILTFMTSGGRDWSKYYSDSGDRFIRSLDVQTNIISDESPAFVNAPNNAESRRTKVKYGDVLLTITGSRIGRVAPVPKEIDGAYISQHVALLRPSTEMIDSIFLSFFLNTSGGQLQIAKSQYGQTKPGLSFEKIKKFKIPYLPITLQKQFVNIIEKVDAQKTRLQSHLTELDTLFASLQQRAFNGEL